MTSPIDSATLLAEPTPLARLADPPSTWLPEASRRAADHWILTVRAGRLRREVRARIGGCVLADDVARRAITWDPLLPGTPETDGTLPALSGAIELRAVADSATPLLTIRATYDPPGGRAGQVIDRLMLHHLARLTIDELARQVAARLAVPPQAGPPSPTPAIPEGAQPCSPRTA